MSREKNENIGERVLTVGQLLKYAQDVAELYQAERTWRKELEQLNEELRQEVAARRDLEARLSESEKRYRSLFEESSEAMYVTTLDGRVVEANAACIQLFDYSQEELYALNMMEIYADPAQREALTRQALDSGTVKDFEVQLLKKGGAIMDCLVAVTLRRGKGEAIDGFHGVIRDITDRKKLDRLMEYSRRLEAMNKMAGRASHHVKNPLAIASSAAQLLLEDDISPDLRRACAVKIVAGIDRASRVIENLLDLAESTLDSSEGVFEVAHTQILSPEEK